MDAIANQSTDKIETQKSYRLELLKKARLQRLEILVWVAVAGWGGYAFFADLVSFFEHAISTHPQKSLGDIFSETAGRDTDSITFIIILTLFLAVFWQVFGSPPLTLLRTKLEDGRRLRNFAAGGELPTGFTNRSIVFSSAASAPAVAEIISDFDPRELLAFYGERTSRLAQKIMNRSNLYLFVGVVIAFSGLLIFYTRSALMLDTIHRNEELERRFDLENAPSERPERPNPYSVVIDWKETILALVPAFGTLFFVEFVAFFFLRQYRSSMDEFRYYDAVRRTREENLVILKMFAENPEQVATKEVLAAMNFYSTPGKLGKDETTEALETRRLQKDEAILFEKLIDSLSALKKLRSQDKD